TGSDRYPQQLARVATLSVGAYLNKRVQSALRRPRSLAPTTSRLRDASFLVRRSVGRGRDGRSEVKGRSRTGAAPNARYRRDGRGRRRSGSPERDRRGVAELVSRGGLHRAARKPGSPEHAAQDPEQAGAPAGVGAGRRPPDRKREHLRGSARPPYG